MEKKKLLVISDSEIMAENMRNPKYGGRFEKYKDAGYEVEHITDLSLMSTGLERSAAVLKVEKEGPEWCTYAPEVLDAISDADLIVMCYSAVNSKFFDAAKKLKHLSVMRSGWENVNIDAATEHNVIVSNAPGRVGQSVADYAVSAILAFNRNLSADDLSKRSGWKGTYAFKPMLVKEMTIGFVGFGIIAKWVTERMKGFGAKFVAYDPYVTQEQADQWGVTMIPELNDLMEMSDVVSVHARLLPATKGLVSAEAISHMKPSAIFVNSARAGLVDEPALVKALQEHKIRGAVLDVFEEEPLGEENPLRKLDNVILTPHTAGSAGDMMSITLDIITDELDRYIAGEPLRNKLNFRD